jgi:hypothetical protein
MELEFSELMVLEVEADDGVPDDFTVRVFVGGPTELPEVASFRARFGDEPIEAVARDVYGTGFTGYLKNEPPDGARLFVEFDGYAEIDTGLTYSRDSGPNA